MQTVPLSLIQSAPRNANRMEQATLAHLIDGIQKSHAAGEPLRQPILVRPMPKNHLGETTYEIVDGHHRVEAARQVGYESVPVVVVSMTDEEAATAAIGMNRIRGELDLGVVGEIFANLAESGIDITVLEATGFTESEIDSLIASATSHPDDDMPLAMEKPAQRQPDDAAETWDLEVVFIERKDRDRVRRIARKLGKGDPATGLLRLVDIEAGEGELDQLLEAAESVCTASINAAMGDAEMPGMEVLRRLLRKITKRRKH